MLARYFLIEISSDFNRRKYSFLSSNLMSVPLLEFNDQILQKGSIEQPRFSSRAERQMDRSRAREQLEPDFETDLAGYLIPGPGCGPG